MQKNLHGCLIIAVLIILILSFSTPCFLWAQGVLGVLETPQPDSFVSGIGFFSGWVCAADQINLVIDGSTGPQVAYGGEREDTSIVCGDSDNGFAGVINWGIFGDGMHTIGVLADGVEVGTATVTVTTFGTEFLQGASGTFNLRNFPQPGTRTTIQWQESLQNFVIVDVTTK